MSMIATDYIKHSAYKWSKTKQSHQQENSFKKLQLVSPKQGMFFVTCYRYYKSF